MSTSAARKSAAQLRNDASFYGTSVVNAFKPLHEDTTRLYHSDVEPAAQQVRSRTRDFGKQLGRDAQPLEKKFRSKLNGFESRANKQLDVLKQPAEAREEQQRGSPTQAPHITMASLGKYKPRSLLDRPRGGPPERQQLEGAARGY